LPGRTNIVVTRQPDFQAEGCLIAHSLEAALELAQGDDEVFITGGTAIYQAGLAYADRIYLTLVHHDFEGDTPMFDFDRTIWQEISREDFEPDEKNRYRYSYLLFEKVIEKAT
jgi:dihydrofolate reductase